MSFFALVLKPNTNLCLSDDDLSRSRHPNNHLCSTCGFKVTVQIGGCVRLTSAVLDADYGAVCRIDPESRMCPFSMSNGFHESNSRYTLKIKSMQSTEVVLCHLHPTNNFQSSIDVQLNAEILVFTCRQSCSIHLTGYTIRDVSPFAY